MTEREYLICLSSFFPFGPARLSLLLSYFGNAKDVWNAGRQSLVSVGLKDELVLEFDSYRKSFSACEYLKKLDKLKVKVFTKSDKGYPKNLLEIESAPLVLYVLGEILEEDENAIAVVGSRKMTSYGREVATLFSSEFASVGVTVVSGLARGIDTVAHKSALEAGGRTIAVLGSGVDIIYPPENKKLTLDITENGALISEFPLGYPALRPNFAFRNRIISGLSKAVLVVEGERKSGTLLTASHAAEQGRTVFFVSGQITSPMSGAPEFLIKNGAKIAFSPSDVLEELDLQFRVDRKEVSKVAPDDTTESAIIEALSREPLHLDEIARILGLEVSLISAKLSLMEIKGLVKNLGVGEYKKI